MKRNLLIKEKNSAVNPTALFFYLVRNKLLSLLEGQNKKENSF